ncbi:MAG TPA: thioredoxin family protein [Blastocatellia bacterium]|nr:thioredoxin family protein [Blastocatellia bacterium]
MKKKRKIEIFSAGCAVCEKTIELVKKLACKSCDIAVLDMRQKRVATKAKKYGVQSLPAIAINGKLAGCCAGRGVDENVLRTAGIGVRMT